MSWVLNALLVIGLAFVARAILAARHVSFLRLVVAAAIGYGVGLVVGGLLVSGADGTLVPDPDAWRAAEGTAVALALQVLVTMGVVVGMELASARQRRGLQLPKADPVTAVRRRVGIAGRALDVTRVASRHSLGSVRARRRLDGAAAAREMREAIEELGGVYVKLGQLLATRPDLMPPEVLAELARLHASATPLGIDVIEGVIRQELGEVGSAFRRIDAEALGSASIAQAHAAELLDGTRVVVKVQRPGLGPVVERDLAILEWVAGNAQRRGLIAPSYRVGDLVEEFAETLRAELDFRNEAGRMAAVGRALADFPELHAPRVYEEYTTARVLVMERLDGQTLASFGSRRPEAAPALADALCRSQIQAMMRGDRFHGDPHPGNLLLLDDGRLGLIDFGMTGKLDAFGRAFVLEALAAVHLQDPALMYEALLTAGSIDPAADQDAIERALAAFMTTYERDEMLSAAAMTDLMKVTADLGIALPAQAALMLRALATLVGSLEVLSPGYPFVERLADLAGLEMRTRVTPASAAQFLQGEFLAVAPLLKRLPRHVDRIATQMQRGHLSARVSLLRDPRDVRIIERLLNKVLLTVLGLGAVGLSVMLIQTASGPRLVEDGAYLTHLLGWIGMFAGTALVLRALLDVLRPIPVGAD